MSAEKLFKLIKEADIESIKQFVCDTYNDQAVLSVCHGRSGDSCVLVAARYGRHDVLQFLIEEKMANVEQVNLDGKTALHEAAQYSQLEVVKYLLHRGANVNSLKRADWTPLMLACTRSSLAVIQTLVEGGGDLHLVNKDGWNCFHIACREGHTDVVDYLLTVGSDTWQTTSKNGRTPLHTVAFHGHLNVAQMLLSRCDYICDTPDSCGTTPLMDVLRMGFIDVAELLIETHGASLACLDNMGRRAIHLAAQAGCDKSVVYMIEQRHVDVNVTSTMSQTTSLHVAAKENQDEMLKLLLSLGANVNSCDAKGRTPLHIAAGCHHRMCLKTLLEHGAIDVADKSGKFARDMVSSPELQHLLDPSIS